MRLVGLFQRQHLQLSLVKISGHRFRGLRVKLEICARPEFLRNRDHFGLGIVSRYPPNTSESEAWGNKLSGPQFAVLLLQAEPERIAVFPVHQQQIAQAVAIHIPAPAPLWTEPENGIFCGSPSVVIRLLRNEINVVIGKQNKIGEMIAV